MKPLVSLITPFFNAMPYFRDYLGCVLRQTWRPLELIAVDDGSSDGSWDCLMKFLPELERVGIAVHTLRRAHEGQAAAVNAALPLVSGEYLTWCDADDLMTPDSVEKKAEYLIGRPELGMVRSDGIVADGDTGRVLARSAREEDRGTREIFDGLFHGTTYCYAGCYMLRTALLFQCYPERQIPLSPEGQNLQLLLPPASRTRCGFLPNALHTYFRRSSGHSGRERSFTENRRRLENFSSLRRAILPYCDCNWERYLQEDRRMLEAELQALCRAAAAKIREERKG